MVRRAAVGAGSVDGVQDRGRRESKAGADVGGSLLCPLTHSEAGVGSWVVGPGQIYMGLGVL